MGVVIPKQTANHHATATTTQHRLTFVPAHLEIEDGCCNMVITGQTANHHSTAPTQHRLNFFSPHLKIEDGCGLS